VLGEFKTAMVSPKSYQDDDVKLVFMGKKAVDGLYKAGYPIPVVLIHGKGMLMDVYTLIILSEAIYHLQSLGTVHLVSGPYQFRLLQSIGPLLSAEVRAAMTMIRTKRKEDWAFVDNHVLHLYDVSQSHDRRSIS
jgi:hypothetical protein